MKPPVLVIMAAGMGSRYGGLKQIDPIDEFGNIIIDFSIYDALKAGFKKVVFIIKKEDEKEFKLCIGDRISKEVEVAYAYQELTNLPNGYQVPKDRTKPWGTAQAVYSCIDIIDEPFAVINADDYYGVHAFQMIYNYLIGKKDKYQYVMIGYLLHNTLTDKGYVARGICTIDQEMKLVDINERTRIEKHSEKIEYTIDDGITWKKLEKETIVSMNMWGFMPSILQEIEKEFPLFLEENLKTNPLKCEFFLPSVVNSLLMEGKASVEVLKSADKWYGVTYKEDKKTITEAIRQMKEQGIYPVTLWEVSR